MNNLECAYDFFKTGKDQAAKKNSTKKWLRCKEATLRYGVSRPTIMSWAKVSGSLLRIEDTILIDSEKMDDFIESFRIPCEIY